MKVLFLTTGTDITASTRVRVHQYFPYLERAGIQYFVICMSPSIVRREFKILEFFEKNFNKVMRYLKLVLLSIVCDIVFIQKVLLRSCVQNLIRILNKNIIFDFDDAIWISYKIPTLGDSAICTNSVQTRLRLSHIIRISKYVVLTNDYIKAFAAQFNKNILVITGPINCTRYFPAKKSDSKNIVIGWISSPAHTFYLKPLFNVFKRISQNYPNIIIKLIGASDLAIDGVNLVIKKWTLNTEVKNLQDFDIGIMPLPDDERTRGKGGYKLLQYMALGIPCVASPVGINSTLIKEGLNGYLADSEDQWFEKLEMLIKDRGLRRSMGANGRKIVEEQYSLEVSAPKLIELTKKVGAG